MKNERNMSMRMESYSPQNLSKIWNKFDQNLGRQNKTTQSQGLSSTTQKQGYNQQTYNANMKNSLK